MHLGAQGGAIYWILKKNSERSGLLKFSDFSVDESLNDRPQKFLGDDIHHLRPHLVQNALHHGLYQGWVRHSGICRRRFGVSR